MKHAVFALALVLSFAVSATAAEFNAEETAFLSGIDVAPDGDEIKQLDAKALARLSLLIKNHSKIMDPLSLVEEKIKRTIPQPRSPEPPEHTGQYL